MCKWNTLYITIWYISKNFNNGIQDTGHITCSHLKHSKLGLWFLKIQKNYTEKKKKTKNTDCIKLQKKKINTLKCEIKQ